MSSSALTPKTLFCGPDPLVHRVRIEIVLEDGRTIRIPLDLAHARSLSRRLEDVVSGCVLGRPPSRRVLEIALVSDEEAADTVPPLALGGTGT
jgi:hypothetical protein